MTSEQYFKPAIEDFFEGAVYYTVARNVVASEYGDYVYMPAQCSIVRDARLLAHLVKDITGGNVYMKYLDGEQIEAFGFDRINTPPWSYSMAMNAPEIEWFCKGQWIISFNNKFRNMGIYQYDAKNFGQYLNFSGEIRDINRFKMIVDWIIVSYERRVAEEAKLQQNQLLYGNENKKKESGSDTLQIGSPGQET